MNVILVAAEERGICESLRAALPETDLLFFEPTTDHVVRRLISIQADVVLIDDAPGLGQQTLLKVIECAPRVPCLVLSSRRDPETLASLTIAGARQCLVKPFSCEELRAALQRLAVPVPAPQSTAPVDNDAHASSSALNQHQTALRSLGRTFGHIKNAARLGQSLVDATVDVFDAVRSAVLIEQHGLVRVAASHGVPESVASQLRLSFASGLMRWFEENACLIDRTTARNATAATKEMQVLGARLAVPILARGRVCGAILIGEKASGIEYSVEEKELLSTFARLASTSFENAQLYQDLSRQQARLDAVLANVTAGVVTVLPNKCVGMMNQSAERILQLRAVDVLGRSVQKLGSGFADVALRTLADGTPRLRQEVRDPAVNATLGLSATPLGDQGVVIIFSKIPAEKVAPEDVAYSPFWEFLASRVAQEIKNPMVAVNTFAQLLPKKYDSEDFRTAFADVVQKEVTRINNVVETLFDFAQHPRLVLQKSNMHATLQNVLDGFQEELAARNINVHMQWDPDVTEVEMDPIHFSRAVHNVIQNSIDAMPGGGILEVATHRSGADLELVISDTGPGIAAQDASLVFMPFFSTKERGMGLGLTVANRIMEQHEGKLELRNSTNKGGVFALRLPAARAGARPHAQMSHSVATEGS